METDEPIGTPEQLQLALDGSIDASRRLIEELEELRVSAQVVVDAWHGQSSVSMDLAMIRLEAQLRRKKETNP